MIGVLGSASTLGIGLAVYLDDQFTQAAGNINNTLTALNLHARDFSDGMSRIAGIGDSLAQFGDRVFGFAKNASQEFATFEHSINATGIIAGLAKGDKGFKSLGDNAQRLAGIYGQLPEQIAQAELELAKGGKSVDQINNMTEAVIALGAATGTTVSGGNGAATVLLNIMQAYNAAATDTKHYADIITSAANQSTIDVRDLFESLRYSADVASTLKIPFEETATAIATLGNAGLKGSMAGTAYANLLRYAEHGIGIFATKKQQTSMGLMGITKKDMLDEQGHIRSMSELLKTLRDRTKTFSDNDKLNVLEGVFGVRGNRALLNLLNGQDRDTHGTLMSSFDAMKDKIHQDTLHNITQNTAQRMTDDAQGGFNKMASAWMNFKIAIGSTLATTFKPIISFITSLLNHLTTFVQGPVGSWLVKWVLILGSTMGPVGRMIAIGARFAGYIFTSAGRLTNAFTMARVASNSIRAQITAAAQALTNAALTARGITTFVNRSTGAQMLAARGAGGRFVGGRVARTGMSTMLGVMFGRTGLRMATSIERFIAPLVSGLGIFTRFFGIIRIAGGVLGRVLGWLFGWEGMLADLILTMLTGKGIFEWLWSGLKAVFGWLFGETDKQKSKGHVRHEYDHSRDWAQRPQTNAEAQASERLMKEKTSQFQKVTYVFHVTPPANGDGKYTKELEVEHQRQLASYAIAK